jgi:hypothetical protein
MAGHSRSKNGVALRAYLPAIHVLKCRRKNVDHRTSPVMTARGEAMNHIHNNVVLAQAGTTKRRF